MTEPAILCNNTCEFWVAISGSDALMLQSAILDGDGTGKENVKLVVQLFAPATSSSDGT